MKTNFSLFILFFIGVFANAQYAKANEILDRLEERMGINQNLSNVDVNNKKFMIVHQFDDHTERNFVVIQGNSATYVELFDDKESGKTSSNVFSGDIVRSNKNIVSMRFDKLEGKKVQIPITKTFLLTQQKKTLYLVDINTKERWIDETAFGKKQK